MDLLAWLVNVLLVNEYMYLFSLYSIISSIVDKLG